MDELEEKVSAKDSLIETLQEQVDAFQGQLRSSTFKDGDRCRELELKTMNLEQ